MPDAQKNRFELLTKLGEGGMGVVYEAIDRVRDVRVAYKTLHQLSGTNLYRLKREFRVASAVSHPNIVTLFELGAEGSRWYITMELVPGQDFLTYVRNGRGVPTTASDATEDMGQTTVSMSASDEPDVHLWAGGHAGELGGSATTVIGSVTALADMVDLARLRGGLGQLVSGLDALHGQGIVHRDLKPSNIRVTSQERVVLLDFGIVGRTYDPDESFAANQVSGTPLYMAPEQARGGHPTAKSDWYAFGVLLYLILTGRYPFTGAARWVMQTKQVADPPAPRSLISVIPEPLNQLCMGLLQRDPNVRLGSDDVHRVLEQNLAGSSRLPRRPTVARPVAGRAPFVGRAAQLQTLWQSFADSERQRPVIVWLHGASGLGKSELIHFFLSELKARKAAIPLSGRCHEQESVPFKALDSLIDALSGYLLSLPGDVAQAMVPADVAALGRVFPVLRRVAAVANSANSVDIPDRQRLRQRAFAALQQLLANIAARSPLVLAIDDLQWGDADSGALLSELLSSPEAPPLLLIASYRDDYVEPGPLLDMLRRHPELVDPGPRVRDIALAPLTERDATKLAGLLFERADREVPESCPELAKESRGSPFFVQELVRYTLERSGDTDGPDAQPMRPTLERVLDARLALLGSDALQLLRVVATAGRPLERDIAVAAADVAPNDERALTLARASNMLRVHVSGDGTQRLEMYHDRIRRVVVDSMSDELALRQHGQLARVMEAADSVDHEALALHYRAAGDAQKAGFYMATAARAAAAALAFDHAAQLYRMAIDTTASDARAQSQLSIGLGNALANAGRGAEAARAYLSAVDAPDSDPVELRRLAATQYLLGGYFDEGVAVLKTVLAAAGLTMPSTPRRALVSLLWRRALVRLRGSGVKERKGAPLGAQERATVGIFWTLSSALGMIDIIRGQDYQARHFLSASRTGDPYLVARAVAMEMAYSASAGRATMRRTNRLVARANELAERSGQPHAIGLARLCTAIASFCVGEWHDARGHVESAIATFRERCTGVAWEVATGLNFKLNSLYYTGEWDLLRTTVLTELKGASERGDRYQAAVLRTSFGELAWLVEDRPDTASEQVELAIETWSRQGFQMQHYWALRALCYIDLYSGAGERAMNRLNERWSALSRSLLLRVQVIRVQMVHLRAKSALCAAQGAASCQRLLRDASRYGRALKRERTSWVRPLARLIDAGVSAVRGDTEAAVQHLAAAERDFERHGMAIYAATAGWHRGELSGGEVGEKLAAERAAELSELGIRNVERMTSMLAPGCSGRRARPGALV